VSLYNRYNNLMEASRVMN